MTYKTRTPVRPMGVAYDKIRTVLTLESQGNMTTQNLHGVKKNRAGHQ